ncbi:hypothetical protein SCHPADRAFT_906777, partial [Schizopora paradoxa]
MPRPDPRERFAHSLVSDFVPVRFGHSSVPLLRHAISNSPRKNASRVYEGEMPSGLYLHLWPPQCMRRYFRELRRSHGSAEGLPVLMPRRVSCYSPLAELRVAARIRTSRRIHSQLSLVDGSIEPARGKFRWQAGRARWLGRDLSHSPFATHL